MLAKLKILVRQRTPVRRIPVPPIPVPPILVPPILVRLTLARRIPVQRTLVQRRMSSPLTTPPHTEVYAENGSDLAIRGADPVAYFTEGAAVPGVPDYEYEWNGATWRFSSADNLATFMADPEAYAPQYGGYCAKAMSEGNLASVDPRAWKIVDGKLYLNYSQEVQAQWFEDIPGNIAKADAFWPNVLAAQTFYENQISWTQ